MPTYTGTDLLSALVFGVLLGGALLTLTSLIHGYLVDRQSRLQLERAEEREAMAATIRAAVREGMKRK